MPLRLVDMLWCSCAPAPDHEEGLSRLACTPSYGPLSADSRGRSPALQVMMFSATLHSQEVKDIAQRVCHQPILIDLKVGSR